MLGRQQHERGAVDRVDARREDLDRVAAAGDRELYARAFRAADPVPLHDDDLLGPCRQRLESFQQFVGVRRDAEEPLLQLARDDGRATAPAGAVDHLFVGQHRLVDRTPVDRRAPPVRQPALEHPQEDPLVELVVLGQTRGDLTAPRVADPETLQLPFHVGDVVERRRLGVGAALDRRVLSREAERVPAEGMQHVVAAHPLRARHDVADDVVADVADVRVAGRVREHLQTVELLTRGIDVDLECLRRCPRLLPFLVQLLRFELGHRDSTTIVPSRPRTEMRSGFAGFERADVGRPSAEIVVDVGPKKRAGRLASGPILTSSIASDQNANRAPIIACRGNPPPPNRFVSTRKFAGVRISRFAVIGGSKFAWFVML